MVTFNELCKLAEQSGAVTPQLQQACSLPRVDADMKPLPAPDGESSFDSSWELLLSSAPIASEPATQGPKS